MLFLFFFLYIGNKAFRAIRHESELALKMFEGPVDFMSYCHIYPIAKIYNKRRGIWGLKTYVTICGIPLFVDASLRVASMVSQNEAILSKGMPVYLSIYCQLGVPYVVFISIFSCHEATFLEVVPPSVSRSVKLFFGPLGETHAVYTAMVVHLLVSAGQLFFSPHISRGFS